ncbi:MAG: hypothetical protein R3B45_07700 [Bdellovibrionota bacterium]
MKDKEKLGKLLLDCLETLENCLSGEKVQNSLATMREELTRLVITVPDPEVSAVYGSAIAGILLAMNANPTANDKKTIGFFYEDVKKRLASLNEEQKKSIGWVR